MGDLRWHPSARHPSGYVGPALVGLVTDADTAEAINLHRTWIASDGSKPAIQPPRLLAKGHRKSGGVIRLWPDDFVTIGLAIAEGVETALTAARGFMPVWAVIDAGNLANFPVLAGIEALTVCVDHDKPDQMGRQRGLASASEVCRRWLAAGREVRRWQSPVPGQDINDRYRSSDHGR